MVNTQRCTSSIESNACWLRRQFRAEASSNESLSELRPITFQSVTDSKRNKRSLFNEGRRTINFTQCPINLSHHWSDIWSIDRLNREVYTDSQGRWSPFKRRPGGWKTMKPLISDPFFLFIDELNCIIANAEGVRGCASAADLTVSKNGLRNGSQGSVRPLTPLTGETVSKRKIDAQ